MPQQLTWLTLMLLTAGICVLISLISCIGFCMDKKKELKERMLNQETIDEIRHEVRTRVTAQQCFTAYDVTQYLRKWGVVGKHDDFKQVVHQMFESGEMDGYNRELRDLGGPIPAWYYYHRSDYAAQQYATNVGTLPCTSFHRSVPTSVTTGYVSMGTAKVPQRDPVAQDQVSIDTDGSIIAKPDKRGTICVPARAMRSIRLAPGNIVAAVPDRFTQKIHLMHVEDVITPTQQGCRLYTVDKDYNVRVTSIVVDDACAWSETYRVEVNKCPGLIRGTITLVPLQRSVE